MSDIRIKKSTYKTKKIPNYSYMQICGDLCGGTCCNHGMVSNARFKKITDKLCTEYRMSDERKRKKSLIKIPVIKWFIRTDSLEIIAINELANTCIDTISKEKDKNRLAQLQKDLDNLNQKLIELTNDSEIFTPVTNHALKETTKEILTSNNVNICMYKDHKKTNLCSVHNGIKDEETGCVISRPSPCSLFGSDKYPCPWHSPEKYGEIFTKMKELLEKTGHKGLSKEAINKYISEQYNLNKTFEEKIWQPYLKTFETEV